MSMHKIPLTELERTGLEAHHLNIGTPSQLSDCFRLGVQWAIAAQKELESKAYMEAWQAQEDYERFGD